MKGRNRIKYANFISFIWFLDVCKQVKCESKGCHVKLDEDIKAKVFI